MNRTKRMARAIVATCTAVILGLTLAVLPTITATAAGEVHVKAVIGSGFSEVDGYGGWIPATAVTVSVEDPATPQNPDFSTSTGVDPTGGFTVDLRGTLQLRAGDLITATQGTETITITVTTLLVKSVEPSGMIRGTAIPGSEVLVSPYGPNGEQIAPRTVTTDPSGNWSVNYAVTGPKDEPPFDIRTSPVRGGGAFQDNYRTQFNWTIPSIQVFPNTGGIGLEGWQPSIPVDVTVDDPRTPVAPDFAIQVTTSSSGRLDQSANLPGGPLLLAGDVATATGGGVTVTTTLTDVQVTSVDPSTDSVSGSAAPGSAVRVDVVTTCPDPSLRLGCPSPGGGSERGVVADGAGHWTADFGVAGSGLAGGAYDIKVGTSGGAIQDQGDGSTFWGWQAPRINALISEDRVSGSDWTPGTTLAVTVVRAGQPVFTGEVTVAQGFPNGGSWDVGLTSVTGLQPGDTITVSGAHQTAITIVSGVSVQSVNAATDVVSGSASPGSAVWVIVQENPGPGGCSSPQSCFPAGRLVTADTQGNWVADFAAAGTQPGETAYDLVTGSTGFAAQADRDGDTQAGWAVGATVQGTVTAAAGGTPIGNAVVSVCDPNQSCHVTRANGAGHWSVGGLPAGHYTARVMPPNTTLVAAILSGDLAENATLTLDAALTAAQPLPNGVTIIGAAIDPVSGVPMVLWRAAPVIIQVPGMPSGCTGTWTFTVINDVTGITAVQHGDFIETPPGSGIYLASIDLDSLHGLAHFVGTLNCQEQPPVTIDLYFYIDPSGTVVDQLGNPVAGATVTLRRQDTPGAAFTPVPAGSALMSPGNRTNPDTSTATGAWGWDVVPGTYQVRASKAGCTSPTDPSQLFVDSGTLQIPPPATGLTLVLACPGTPTKVDTATAVVSSVNPSVSGAKVTFTATVSPSAATGSVRFTIDGKTVGAPVTLVAGHATYTTSVLTVGAHQVSATYSGDAAYRSSTSSTIVQSVRPLLRATRTTITNDREGASTFGQNVRFTATVRASSYEGTPTGGVQFSIDGKNVGGVRTLDYQGRATYSTASLSGGRHTVIATYSGSAIFAGSGSAPFIQVVNKAASKTVLTSNPDPSVFGQSVIFTARVTPPDAGGVVQFKLDGTTLGGPVGLDATGRATFATNKMTVGAHTVSAVYGGNVNYRSSTDTCHQRVTKAASQTVVISSGTPANRGTTVAFTATVTAVSPGLGTPAGNVQFRIDGVNVGTPVALNHNGHAAYATRALPAGKHSVYALYSGSVSFNASTSTVITQRIQ